MTRRCRALLLLAALGTGHAAAQETLAPDAPVEIAAAPDQLTRIEPSAATQAELYDPARDLGTLFRAVQLAEVFPDSKTFVDARPLQAPGDLVRLYLAGRDSAGFDLATFVARHFAAPRPERDTFRTVPSRTMEAHIRALWPVLTRPADVPDARSSRIPLPHRYVVPGGRFREIYYWDSYFTMLGLVESGRVDLVRDMLDDFAHLVRTFGHVPNGARSYYLSRSQPPFLAAMVSLYAEAQRAAFYRNVRATAESGWDFSNRWMRDPADLRSLETTALVPVDLNSLLYHLERTIASLRRFRGAPGDAQVATRFDSLAARRRRALLAAAWDPASGFSRVVTKPPGARKGVRRYGSSALADAARRRWLDLVRSTYRATGKMVEKYDVVQLDRTAGGGEYPTQDGFGWTNGVTLALLAPRGLVDSTGAEERDSRPGLRHAHTAPGRGPGAANPASAAPRGIHAGLTTIIGVVRAPSTRHPANCRHGGDNCRQSRGCPAIVRSLLPCRQSTGRRPRAGAVGGRGSRSNPALSAFPWPRDGAHGKVYRPPIRPSALHAHANDPSPHPARRRDRGLPAG